MNSEEILSSLTDLTDLTIEEFLDRVQVRISRIQIQRMPAQVCYLIANHRDDRWLMVCLNKQDSYQEQLLAFIFLLRQIPLIQRGYIKFDQDEIMFILGKRSLDWEQAFLDVHYDTICRSFDALSAPSPN